MVADADRRTVSLSVPANADYLGFARLALAAVCRLTPLAADEVIDLKLAVTEAASGALGEEGGPARGSDRIAFAFRLEDERLEVEVHGAVQPQLSAEEQELGRAVVEATVDELDGADGGVRLVKYLKAGER
ncbi:MAG: hypothetical protein M3N16_06710 [Actinomycetota bacterium]|nr:hypothetical protein [Actinomycetota bacterium]